MTERDNSTDDLNLAWTRCPPLRDAACANVRQYGDVELVCEEGTRSVSFTHPGMHMAMMGRDRLPMPVYLLAFCGELLDTSCYIPVRAQDGGTATLHDWPQMMARDRISAFAAALRMDMSRAVYDVHVRKAPVKQKTSLVAVGTASILTTTEVFAKEPAVPLVCLTTKVVTVDIVKRKAEPLPQWYRHKFGTKSATPGTDFRVERFVRPPNTFVHRLQVTWFDTDSNSHASYFSYIRFATDAVHKAVPRSTKSDDVIAASLKHNNSQTPNAVKFEKGGNFNAMGGITTDVLRCGLKTVKICYLGECLENDVLLAHVWHERELEVRCSIEHEDGRVCAQLYMEYFPPSPKL